MAGIVKTKVIRSLRTSALLAVLAGCSSPAPPAPVPATPSSPAPVVTPAPMPEPSQEAIAEPPPEDLAAVVAPRPHSEELKAALAGMPKAARTRTNPFSGQAGETGTADYLLLCAPCHGETGQGGGPASIVLGGLATNLLASSETESLTDGERFLLVAEGIPGTNMQGFGLARSEAQIWKILAHIDSLR